MGGFQGQASDVEIHAKEMLRMKEDLNQILATHSGKPIDQVQKDTDRDYFMSGAEAQAYGIVDHVITSRDDLGGGEDTAESKDDE
jgi:ATP-dependent Clp protease protease subunit